MFRMFVSNESQRIQSKGTSLLVRLHYKPIYRYIVSVLLMLFYILISITSLADQTNSFRIHGTNSLVCIPNDWYYVDAGSTVDPVLLSALDLTEDELKPYMQESNLAFFAVSKNLQKFLSLQITETDLNDYSSFSDSILLSLGKQFADLFLDSSLELEKIRTLKSVNPFIKVFINSVDGFSQSVYYITVVQHKAYLFTLQSNMPATLDNESLMDAIASSFVPEDVTTHEYYIDGIPLSIQIPQEMYVLNDEELQIIQNHRTYLFYASSDSIGVDVYIDLYNSNSQISSLNSLSSEELDQFLSLMASASQGYGDLIAEPSKMETINDMTYLKSTMSAQLFTEPSISVSYITILNHKTFAISFIIHSADSSTITPAAYSFIQSIMDSVHYPADVLSESKNRDILANPLNEIIIDNKISISIPQDYYAFWRNMPADSYSLHVTGDSIETWDSIFTQHPELLLLAEAPDQDRQITLIKDAIALPNLKDRTDSDIISYIKSVLNPQGKTENQYSNCYYRIMETSLYKFIFVSGECTQPDSKPYFARYFTYTDGQLLSLDLYSSSPFTDDDYTDLRGIILSLAFDGSKQSIISESELITGDQIEDIEHQYDELTLYIPDDFIVFDRTSDEYDLIASACGMKPTIIPFMLEQINASMFMQHYGTDIDIISLQSIPTTETIDFTLDNLEIVKQMQSMYILPAFSSSLANVSSQFIYSKKAISSNGKDLIWLKFKGIIKAQNIDTIIYSTMYNNMNYIVRIEGETIEDSLEREIDAIILNCKINHNK